MLGVGSWKGEYRASLKDQQVREPSFHPALQAEEGGPKPRLRDPACLGGGPEPPGAGSKVLTGAGRGWYVPEPALSLGEWEEGGASSLFWEGTQTGCSVSKETLCHIGQLRPPFLSSEFFVQRMFAPSLQKAKAILSPGEEKGAKLVIYSGSCHVEASSPGEPLGSASVSSLATVQPSRAPGIGASVPEPAAQSPGRPVLTCTCAGRTSSPGTGRTARPPLPPAR